MGRRARKRRVQRPRLSRKKPPGLAPGTLLSHDDAQPTSIDVIVYGEGYFEERKVDSLEQLAAWMEGDRICWINVNGLKDAKKIEQLGHMLGLHALALEDVVNLHQRPKAELYGDSLFIVARMAHGGEHVRTEQLSIFLGPKYVLTLQEFEGDCLHPVRQRIRQRVGGICQRKADYLVYAILDAIIDGYFPVVESFAEELDRLEELVVESHSVGLTSEVHAIRHVLLLLRRSLRPHGELLHELTRPTLTMFSDETRLFLRDCHDHAVRLMDMVEVYREISGDIRDFSMSLSNYRMTEIMQVLTVISTIFIPLTFVVGVYGMNFDTSFWWNMPELRWRYGYLMAWGIMSLITAGMVFYFVRRGWLTGSPPTQDVSHAVEK